MLSKYSNFIMSINQAVALQGPLNDPLRLLL